MKGRSSLLRRSPALLLLTSKRSWMCSDAHRLAYPRNTVLASIFMTPTSKEPTSKKPTSEKPTSEKPTSEEPTSMEPTSMEPQSPTSNYLTRSPSKVPPCPTARSTRIGSKTKKAVVRTWRTNKPRSEGPTLEGYLIPNRYYQCLMYAGL